MTEKPNTLDRQLSLPQVTWEGIAFVLILIASVLLHVVRLGDMAMHHDESIHAWVSWRFLTGAGGFTCAGGMTSSTYCYDPVYHGPALYVLTLVSFFLFGDGDWQARLPEALAGIGLTLSTLWLKPYFGKRGTLLLAAIVSIAPTLLYFTRFARHDALMVLWVFWIVVGFFRFIDSRDKSWLWLMATGIGLALTTHELYYIIGFLFFWFVGLRLLSERAATRTLTMALVGIAIGSVVLEALILAGVWNGDITDTLNGSGLAFVLFFLSGISLAIMQLWPREQILTPLFSEVWRDQRVDVYVGIGIIAGIFVLLYGNFFTYPVGILDGMYQGLAYWLGSQQNVARGDQPWYYYLLILGLHEPLAIAGAFSIAVAAVVSAVQRIKTKAVDTATARLSLFTAFNLYWFVGALVFFSWAGEKMPWLSIHISLPAYMLVVWGLLQLYAKIPTDLGRKRWYIPGTILLALLSIAVGIEKLNDGSTTNMVVQAGFPLLVGAASLYALFTMASAIGYAHAGRIGVVVVAGLLGAYSIRSSFLVNFEAPDSARDPMVYTQTSPDVPRIARDVLELSINQTRTKRSSEDYAGGLSMPFIIDTGGENGEGSLDWPFQWYFRHMQRVERRDATFFETATAESFNVKAPDSDEQILAPMVLASANHITEGTRTALEANYVKLYDGQLNWWFPEGDKCNPTGQGYRSFYFSSLSTLKAAEACPELDTTQLPSLLAPVLWPFDTSHWASTWKYLMYRDLPEGLSLGGRQIEAWVRKDLAGSSAGAAATTTTPTFKMVADRVINLDNAAGPRGIAVGRDGTVAVADSDLNQILIYGPDGTQKRALGTRGNGTNQFNEPRGIAIGPDGSIYVADTWNARVVKLSPSGDWITTWGTGATDFGEGRVASVTDGTEAGNAANPLGFFGPRGIAVSQRGEVFVADTGNKRIVVTDSTGNFLYQWGSFGADPGKFNEPVGVAVDVDGAVIVGDTWNGRVQYFSTLGNEDGRVNTIPIQLWKVAGWQAQTYDDPYVTVYNGVAYASVPKRNAVGSAGIDGNERFRWGGNGTDNASFLNPSGLAASADGKIYVLDRGNNRILIFSMPE